MEDLSKKRPCVMIVDHDLDFGIKLADWLSARGYQAGWSGRSKRRSMNAETSTHKSSSSGSIVLSRKSS